MAVQKIYPLQIDTTGATDGQVFTANATGGMTWTTPTTGNIAPAFNQANSANIAAGAAFDKANSANYFAYVVNSNTVAAFGQANAANIAAGAAFDQANLINIYSTSAFSKANAANISAGAAFDKANAANYYASLVDANAIAAFAKANLALASAGGTLNGDLTVSGNLYVTGNTIWSNVSTFIVNDPLIYLAGNNYTSDIVDIGFVANYVNATGANVHTGLVRDAGNKEYYFFEGYDKEPQNNVIDPNGNNFTISVLNAKLKSSNIILNGINAFSWINSSYIAANTANLAAGSAFDKANAANISAGAAFDRANTVNTYSIAAFAQANLVAGAVTTANTIAVAAFGQANAAINIAQSAFAQANSGVSSATLNGANVAVGAGANAYSVLVGTAANNIAIAAFNQANSAQTLANTAQTIAIAAFAQANIGGGGGGASSNSFSTINVNGTLVVAETPTNILTLLPSGPITLTGDAANDKITIGMSVPVGNAGSQTFAGNGSNTVFTMSSNVSNARNMIVSINGLTLIPNTHYSVSGNTITFTDPPSIDSTIEVRNLEGVNATNASYNRVAITATADQTSFTAPYTVGYVEVYMNGVLLNASDYTATNGTSIVLASAATAGDIIEVIALNVSTFTSSGYTRTSYIATSNQTSFTATYTPNYVQVYVNGVLLDIADYTATSGTGIVLGIGASANDSVDIVSLNVGGFTGGVTITGTPATGQLTSWTGGTSVQGFAPSAAGDIPFSTNGTTFASTQKIVRANTVTLTTQTSVDFTGIPSWVKRITVMFSGVSTSGTASTIIQLGSGSVANTGYNSTAGYTGATQGAVNATNGFVVHSGNATEVQSGILIITSLGNNLWVCSGSFKYSTTYAGFCGGDVTLSGTLDRVRLATGNGTDTFDAGSVNILYE